MSRNYDILYDRSDAKMLKDADDAISQCELWDWLKNYSPEDGQGFMFTKHPNLDRINKAMQYSGHSGSSYAWTMRNMEYIAKNGWQAFVNQRMTNCTVACPCRLKEGYRFGWCGVAGGGVPGCEH
jgi:hypothetical protein